MPKPEILEDPGEEGCCLVKVVVVAEFESKRAAVKRGWPGFDLRGVQREDKGLLLTSIDGHAQADWSTSGKGKRRK